MLLCAYCGGSIEHTQQLGESLGSPPEWSPNSQNLYFVGVVLTYLLWGAILKLRETRMRLIQLVLALGIYFSADAMAYALRNLFPSLEPVVLRWIPPIMGVWLPLAWAYTMAKVSEDSRLAPARLMVKAQ